MIYNSKNHWWRLIIGFTLILIIALSPLILGLIGSYFTEMRTGEPCNESNCFWGAFPWYMFFTIPIGTLIGIIFCIIAVIDIIKVWSK